MSRSAKLRSPYLFRGMSDTSFKLVTSLRRNCGTKQTILEKPILTNFMKYAIRDDPSLESSVWRQMMVGQHYGLPTRLLDWSHSSLIALHFATSEQEFQMTDLRRDGIVWRIDSNELARLLCPAIPGGPGQGEFDHVYRAGPAELRCQQHGAV